MSRGGAATAAVRAGVRRPRALAALLGLALAVAACASSPEGTRGSDPDRISEEELDAARAEGLANLEELIQRLRPRWLQTDRIRSFDTPVGILVYEGTSRLGGPEVLAGLSLVLIREVRWLNAAQAGTLPGAGGMHVEGAIVIQRD